MRFATTLALSEGQIAALTTSMRQLGVGTQGGAEALAIFHQVLYDELAAGSLTEPLARIQVDEKNCFGMIERKAVREAAPQFLSKHTAAAAWKHRNLFHAEQEGLAPMPEDRGAEQGDVGGLLECSLALGMVAAETRARGTCCRRTEAWRTCGTWTTVKFCVTRSWCRLTCGKSTSPTPESERSGTHREQKSSAT